ncbi:MAG: hypothetical protein ACXVBU_12145 [Ktedonobacteraceae bacterium]
MSKDMDLSEEATQAGITSAYFCLNGINFDLRRVFCGQQILP